MRNFFTKFGWILKIIASVFVIVLAIVFVTNDDNHKLILITVGGIFILLGAVRIIPLLKTTTSKAMKIILGVEVVMAIGIGITLLILNDNEKFYTSPWFGIMVGFVLYLRGVIYLTGLALFNQQSDKILFWFHLVILTLGVYLASTKVTVSEVVWFLFALAILSALYLAGDSYNGYNKYRKSTGKIKIKIKKSKKQKEAELPIGEEKEESEQSIIVQ